MRKKNLFFNSLILFVFTSFAVSASETGSNSKAVNIPDDVKAIIQNSCFGCHNTDSKNDKAKEKLVFNTLDSLDVTKQIHALKKIYKEIDENEMPPEKFLERFPDKKLTDAEKKTLMDWANNQSKSMME